MAPGTSFQAQAMTVCYTGCGLSQHQGRDPVDPKSRDLQRVKTSCSAPWLAGEAGAAGADALPAGVNRAMGGVGRMGQGVGGRKGRGMPGLSPPHPALPARPAPAGQAVQIAPAIRLSSRKARRLIERENPLQGDRQPPHPDAIRRSAGQSVAAVAPLPGTPQSSSQTPSHRGAPLRALHPAGNG